MLKRVAQVLQELGLITPGARLRYYIDLTTGDSLAISAFDDQARFFQVKASEYVNLRAHYERYCAASGDFGAFVPRPLGYREYDGWSIMVTEGVRHTLARPERVLRGESKSASRLNRQLCDFLHCASRAGADASAAAGGDGRRGWLAALRAHFELTPLARTATVCIRHAQALGVESLHAIPQHGDFVFNNLGWADDKLVVFDWEDYRKVWLPGLDIFTLVMSLFQEDIDALREVVDARGGRHHAQLEGFLQRACEAQGIEPALFRGLVPLYVLVFLYLKSNYGVQVQERMTSLLLQLEPRARTDEPPDERLDHGFAAS
jgi:Phosphotransferase enzyme family